MLQNEEYHLALTAPAGVEMAVTDAAGTPVVPLAHVDANVLFTQLAPGTYVNRVSGTPSGPVPYEVRLTLLSDQGSAIRKSYGVPSALGVLPGRVTYVIDRSGIVRHVFNSMTNIGRHIDDALTVVRELRDEQEMPQ